MADKFINELPTTTTISDTDVFVVEDNAVTSKITKANLKEQLGVNDKAPQSTTYTKTEVDTSLGLKAPIANPTFTGLVTTAGQVKFPATQVPSTDVNTLDDYEEGTFTPVVTANAGTLTSYTASGNYTKVGNVVTMQVTFTITNIGSGSGGFKVAGLPFASKINSIGVTGVEMLVDGSLMFATHQGTNLNTIMKYDRTPLMATGYGYAFSWSITV